MTEATLLPMNLPIFARRLLRPLLDPYRRYRHAKLIHAVRVSIGLLATILLTTGINLPHGEWASVTMLIVIGGLQHHGNIGKKAVERAYGTLIGASVGLLLVVQQAYFGLPLVDLSVDVGGVRVLFLPCHRQGRLHRAVVGDHGVYRCRPRGQSDL